MDLNLFYKHGVYVEVNDEEVERVVCFDHGAYGGCVMDVNITVTNCEDFFVYKLPDVYQFYMRYCVA